VDAYERGCYFYSTEKFFRLRRYEKTQLPKYYINLSVFTALHVMQTRYSDENSVRLSVCLSVCPTVTCVIPDKTEVRSVHICTPYERTFSLVFWEEEWLVGATPFTWNFGSTDSHWSEIADFQPIIARSLSAVTPSEKTSINANRKSTTRFPMSLRWSSYCP